MTLANLLRRLSMPLVGADTPRVGSKLLGAPLRFETRHIEEVIDRAETRAPPEATEFAAEFRDIEAEILAAGDRSITPGQVRSVDAIVHGKLAFFNLKLFI